MTIKTSASFKIKRILATLFHLGNLETDTADDSEQYNLGIRGGSSNWALGGASEHGMRFGMAWHGTGYLLLHFGVNLSCNSTHTEEPATRGYLVMRSSARGRSVGMTSKFSSLPII